MAVLDNDTQVSVLTHGLDHPEGIAWGLDGYAYAGGEAGQLYRIDVERREARQFAGIPEAGFIGGLALDADHNVYACDGGAHRVHRVTQGGAVSTYSTGTADEPFRAPNYPAFDSRGNLYVSDSGDWKGDNGYIYRIAPGGEAAVWDRRPKEFPNGLCMGPGEDHLYVVMSLNPPRVVRVAIERDGTAGALETVVELPGTVPDGIAFDTDGHLYISCYRPDRIYRLAADGDLQVLAEDYEGTLIAAPTNIAFCGRERNVLLSANLGRWHITRYEVGATGLPLHYPSIG